MLIPNTVFIRHFKTLFGTLEVPEGPKKVKDLLMPSLHK